MRCFKDRLFMEEYRRGMLNAKIAGKIEGHMRHCADCADHFAGERRFSDIFEKAVLPQEEFDVSTDSMWNKVMTRIRAEEIQSDLISPAFFRRAMAYSCASIILISVLAFFSQRERMPSTSPRAISPSCFRTISPQPDCQFEKETLKLLDPAVYSIRDMRSFLSEMKRPTRTDLFKECYPQLPVIHVQSDHL
jgi:hypothetical protein